MSIYITPAFSHDFVRKVFVFMKKLFITFGIVSLILLFVSCSKENTNSKDDSYYVEYKISSQGSGYSTFVVKDLGSNLAQSDFPVTYGPVKKGYSAHIQWSTGSGHYCKATISVSKNGEPFVTKATSPNFSYNGALSYTIK